MRTIQKIIELTGGLHQLRVRPLKIEASPMPPLTLEFVGRGPAGGALIAVAHIVEDDGVIQFEPEVQIELGPGSSDWLPVSFRQDTLHVHKTAVTNHNGKIMYDHRLVEDLRAFLSFWDASLRQSCLVEAVRKEMSKSPPAGNE